MKQKTSRILVTGGAGYIGSHMIRVLINNGIAPVVFDNLSTGHKAFIPRGVSFIQGDLRSQQDIQKVFKRFTFDAVLHFAGLISVGESIKRPKLYEHNNIIGARLLLDAMLVHGVYSFVFSSSASVYGNALSKTIRESEAIAPTNPYGWSKALVEQMLHDQSQQTDLRYISLRYFNAAGAIDTAKIGEKHDPETHMIPNLLNAAKNEKPFYLLGDDYATPDGTCIRDYVHVMDLCEAHWMALRYLLKTRKNDHFNLGTGSGYSVSEIIKIAQDVTGRTIRVRTKPRRQGDVPRLVANVAKAKRVLGWQARRDIHAIIRSAWQWHKKDK